MELFRLILSYFYPDPQCSSNYHWHPREIIFATLIQHAILYHFYREVKIPYTFKLRKCYAYK